MTSVQILPIPGKRGGVQFHAIAGKQHADAETAGLALDAITRMLPRLETAVVGAVLLSLVSSAVRLVIHD